MKNKALTSKVFKSKVKDRFSYADRFLVLLLIVISAKISIISRKSKLQKLKIGKNLFFWNSNYNINKPLTKFPIQFKTLKDYIIYKLKMQESTERDIIVAF